jgi:hypothetical protein
MSLRKQVVLTTFSSDIPPPQDRPTFAGLLGCSSMVPATISPVTGTSGIWPLVKT